jgi:hypothetical protein
MGRVESVEPWRPRVLYFILGIFCAAWVDWCNTRGRLDEVRERFDAMLHSCEAQVESAHVEFGRTMRLADDCHDLLRGCEADARDRAHALKECIAMHMCQDSRQRAGSLAECTAEVVSTLSQSTCQ